MRRIVVSNSVRAGIAIAASITLVPRATALAQQLSGGEVRGRVVQAADSVGVPSAEVELLGLALRAYTDNGGQFHALDVAPGTYDVRVRRLGYRSALGRVTILPGAVSTITFALERPAQELSEVIIEGRRMKVPARYSEVYERAARGWGKLFTRDDIERRNPVDLKSLLETLPGVHVNDSGITFERCQAGLTGLAAAVQLTAAQSRDSPLSAQRRPGRIQVYVDGHRVTWTTTDERAEADADRVIRQIHPVSVEAMEVYTGVARIPAEFMSDACAAIVIWTRSY